MKQRVLFFCKHNSCRSQMAEAYLKKLAPDQFEAISAGLYPQMIHPLVYLVMQEDGIDIAGQTAKSIDLYLGKELLDWVIIVCQEGEAECPQLMPLALHTERWPLADPAKKTGPKEEVVDAFRQTRDAVKQRVQNWLTMHNYPDKTD
ncbi:MAG TPA: arsenate reductase ArsC [Anaerohalosphaeraceae bacterium]|nr:arsenate reductase ArsC [Anaerohalosphaeraceae bacterium]HOM75571.1 arsenate reductase ArsC [Anaerohalosphaeraceae bacterium]HPC64353.1 arsenate reductase ArsC [Anaerohalosphaeraceae bacterium]HPO69163.1 arsenate reductase ArsC [Anaerohalosphaeraceae bacterium]HRS70723.1 arsenate reductase ArsC [Anaerohalosphaeraceae bacterium]